MPHRVSFGFEGTGLEPATVRDARARHPGRRDVAFSRTPGHRPSRCKTIGGRGATPSTARPARSPYLHGVEKEDTVRCAGRSRVAWARTASPMENRAEPSHR